MNQPALYDPYTDKIEQAAWVSEIEFAENLSSAELDDACHCGHPECGSLTTQAGASGRSMSVHC
jgi:hypothetical protein